MAYSNVGTPRFYINIPEWLHSGGVIVISQTLMTLPVLTIPVQGEDIDVTGLMNGGQNFLAMLNCPANSSFTLTDASLIDIVNKDGGHNGFRIAKFVESIDTLDPGGAAGSIIMGIYYDMPYSPDLKLTMTREMDGVKRLRTKGGADLVNHKYIKPAMWGNAGAWELYSGTPNQALSRSGRRVWDLSFSYLQDSDVFPMLSSLNPYESISNTGDVYSSATLGDDPATEDVVETDYVLTDETNWHDGETLLDANTFYNQVIHKTNGGQLPFIFQPDKDNNNPEGFAICKFDMKEFKFSQVANGVYNVKLKIREVW